MLKELREVKDFREHKVLRVLLGHKVLKGYKDSKVLKVILVQQGLKELREVKDFKERLVP